MARRWKKNPYGGKEHGIFAKPTQAMLALIDNVKLQMGASTDPKNGMCVMQALSYVTRQSWSDHPICASEVITDRMIGCNDSWNDADRQLLKAVIPDLIGTRPTSIQEEEREVVGSDGKARTFTLWLEQPESTPEYVEAERKRAVLLDGLDYADPEDAIEKLKAACAIRADGERIEPEEVNPVLIEPVYGEIERVVKEQGVVDYELAEVELDPAGVLRGETETE